MNETCRVELLGGLRMRLGERFITRFRSQKTGALLAYLAFYRERMHSREVLIDLFWPSGTLETGRQSLSVALSSLRRLLEPPGTPTGAVIRADRQQVGLNPALVSTDVARFEALWEQAQQACPPAARRLLLIDALEIYRGTLLPGFYDEWLLSEQERLAHAFFEAARALAALLEADGERDRAMDVCQRMVTIDPLREDAHRDLMRLLAETGQTAAAQRQFKTLERLLAQEMGEEPSAATRQLACRIARQAPPVTSEALVVPVRHSSPLRSSPLLLPTGTVTFLLTELQGSAGSWPREDPAFQAILDSHSALVRGQIRRHEGVSFKETGDGSLAAFPRAGDALACAVSCQQALAAQTRPEQSGALRVGMALHTGDAELISAGNDYRGPALDRARRLLTAAHGGQVLCSETTFLVLRHDLPPGMHLIDLGLYRLRDAPEPERLFQVEYPDMVSPEFPAPKARRARVGHLPPSFTRFFGRAAEIARLTALLQADEVRLVTLTGPGGTGKTRLALEAARCLAEPLSGAAWFVPLADLPDPSLIAAAIADAIDLPRSGDIAPLEQVVEALSQQSSLLVLDNFEHLAEVGGAVVQGLLGRVSQLTCLVTSRRVLDLSGEREFAVSPLPTPPSAGTPEQLSLCESVQLFTDRAQAVRPDFQITTANAAPVAELCHRLEGIPLALELAAARLSVLTPRQMLSQLEHRFDFLVSRRKDMPDRHRTLRAAVEWSFRLLPPELQRFFARLSVFRGGWTAESAASVCDEEAALEALARLRECSLVLATEEAGRMRFRMLETLREYAQEQISPSEQDTLSRRHALYFVALAEDGATQRGGEEHTVWLDRLQAEQDNLRSVLGWSAQRAESAEIGLRLGGALWWFWMERGNLTEGRGCLSALLALPEPVTGRCTPARALAQYCAGLLAHYQSDYPGARRHLEESLQIWRECGGDWGIAAALNLLGAVARAQGAYAQARTAYQESLIIHQQYNTPENVAVALNSLAAVAQDQGDAAGARAFCWRAGEIWRAQDIVWGRAWSLQVLGLVAADEGDPETAFALLEESLALRRPIGSARIIAELLVNLGNVACALGKNAEARVFLEESLTIRLKEPDPWMDRRGIAAGLEGLAAVAGVQRQSERAARLLGAASALRERIGTVLTPAREADHDRHVQAARQALGVEGFTRAWDAGQALPPEQAVAEALAPPPL
jgi:predicted ATPase/DNA-binding SARP family transcriptional activator